MGIKYRLLQLIDELSEEELSRVYNFVTEVTEAKEKDLEEHAPAAFWDNDDKIWNEISR